jgi:anti-sigma B factor antagonist
MVPNNASPHSDTDANPAELFEFIVVSEPDAEGAAAAAVRGELDLSTAAEMRDQLYGLLARGGTHLTLDVTELTFIDSTGLGVIVAVLKRSREAGGNLVLKGPSRSARKVLDISGLARIIDVVD